MSETRSASVSEERSAQDKRRSARVVMKVPLNVEWAVEGKQIIEKAESETINAHGAMLIIGTLPPASAIILLHNEATGQKSLARIVSFAGSAPQGRERMTVELSSPSYKFWGIYFPPSDSPIEV
jgi:hypothetical protein